MKMLLNFTEIPIQL